MKRGLSDKKSFSLLCSWKQRDVFSKNWNITPNISVAAQTMCAFWRRFETETKQAERAFVNEFGKKGLNCVLLSTGHCNL